MRISFGMRTLCKKKAKGDIEFKRKSFCTSDANEGMTRGSLQDHLSLGPRASRLLAPPPSLRTRFTQCPSSEFSDELLHAVMPLPCLPLPASPKEMRLLRYRSFGTRTFISEPPSTLNSFRTPSLSHSTQTSSQCSMPCAKFTHSVQRFRR